jgi:hypothetical protein
MTNAWYGVASYTGIAYLERGVERSLCAKYIKIEVVRTNDEQDNGAWTIWTRRLY